MIVQPPEPPLGGSDPALLVGGKRQRADQASRGIRLARLHPVLQCLAGLPVPLVPLRGPPVKDGHQAGLQAVQLRQEHVAEQVMVAVPLPPPVQRHQQQVRPLQIGQDSRGPAAPRVPHRTAIRTCAPAPRSGSGTPAAAGRSGPGTPTPCTRSPAGHPRRTKPRRSPAGRPPAGRAPPGTDRPAIPRSAGEVRSRPPRRPRCQRCAAAGTPRPG